MDPINRKSHSKMRALMGTAAVIVIATCGYFVYDNLQAKAAKAEAEMKQAETVECRWVA